MKKCNGERGWHQLSHREFFIENLLDRIHFIIVMIWWTGLAPREFEVSHTSLDCCGSSLFFGFTLEPRLE